MAVTEAYPDKPKREEEELSRAYLESRARVMGYGRAFTFPWWIPFLIIVGILAMISFTSDPKDAQTFEKLQEGIGMTLGVSFVSYFLGLSVALIVGIIRANPPKPPEQYNNVGRVVRQGIRVLIYNIATIYVQVMRGLPILVVLLVTAFVIVPIIRDDVINATIVPALRNLLNNPDIPDFFWRGSSPPAAIVALAFTYGAYMSETIRAGIQSVPKGQIEAAYSVGMTYWQTMRHIVLPQAFRNVLPPLGNDLVAMVKDSSLLTILGVGDITHIAKKTSSSNFRYLETYAIVSIIYLSMTILGSYIVQSVERTIDENQETPRWIQTLQEMRSKNKRKAKVE